MNTTAEYYNYRTKTRFGLFGNNALVLFGIIGGEFSVQKKPSQLSAVFSEAAKCGGLGM
ncbi:MAG: hypothetical protein WC007_16285 [Pelobacteraceae bacterium]